MRELIQNTQINQRIPLTRRAGTLVRPLPEGRGERQLQLAVLVRSGPNWFTPKSLKNQLRRRNARTSTQWPFE